MPKIIILMSDTGGGHRASAQALEAGFAERFGDKFQVEIVELWKNYTPWPINQLPKTYSPIVSKGIWLWEFLWRASERPWLTNAFLRLIGLFVQRSMQQAFIEHQPDLVISVHPLMQEIPLYNLHKWRKDVPFVTVITDLGTINPLWLHPGVDRCFVPTEAAYVMAQQAGLSDEQLRVYGLPIRPAFARPTRSKQELRRDLALDQSRLTVLVVGGGEGMGAVAHIARAVADRLAADRRHAQMVVVCGRNQNLRNRLLKQVWPIPTHIQGFVTNMPEWMAVSDCIVTKAGPGTIAEALISGLPILISGYIPGQEEGNIPYVVDNGAGAYSQKPAEIAAIISRWFGPEQDRLAEMGQRSRALGHPQSTFDIVEEIASLLEPCR